MNNSQIAKEKLNAPECTCVFICTDDTVLKSGGRGITPLLSVVSTSGTRLTGASAADTVVGKAAAMLLCSAQISYLWAKLISEPALKMLQTYGVQVEYELLVSNILNRAQNDSCPLEKLLLDTDEIEPGIRIISDFAASLVK